MKNNESQTTLQKVLNVIGTVFSIICLCYGMYSIIKEIIEYGFDLDNVVEDIKAYFEGMKIAHKQNMQWVKHGGQFVLLQDDEEV